MQASRTLSNTETVLMQSKKFLSIFFTTQIRNLLSQQLQMDKIPSRHAITEIMSWISLMENVIQQDEENIKNVVGQKEIQGYIQKYKVLSGNINFPFDLSPLLPILNI